MQDEVDKGWQTLWSTLSNQAKRFPQPKPYRRYPREWVRAAAADLGQLESPLGTPGGKRPS